MSIFLTILYIIICIIALLLLIGLFAKKDFVIEREILIEKKCTEVFYYISRLKNQDYYSKWVMTDPNMQKTFKGVDGKVGFVYAWDSDNKQAGKGEQEIMRIEENKKIDIEVRFEKPFVSVGQTPFRVEEVSAYDTKVVWGFYSTFKYPMNAMCLLMNMESKLGKDMEISLRNLKRILEN
jgi:hypothetical protein